MFTTILCCSDGSPHADDAVRVATDLAVCEHAHLHLVHVKETLTARHLAGQDASVIEPEIVATIQAQAAKISVDEIPCELHITTAPVGHVAECVAETAAQTGAELVVIATRGRSALGGLLLGSVTQRLLQISPCPVLAIPPDQPTLPANTPRPTMPWTARHPDIRPRSMPGRTPPTFPTRLSAPRSAPENTRALLTPNPHQGRYDT